MAPMLIPMKEKFDKYWADYNVFFSCAAVLDPRCKLGFVSYCYGKLYAPDEAERRVAEVKKTLVNLFAEYSGAAVSEAPSDGAKNSRGSRGDGADMFNDYENYIQSQRTNVERSQLELYLEETPRKLNDELDVLEFWSKSSMRYPQLASMARDVLAVPISSVLGLLSQQVSADPLTGQRGQPGPCDPTVSDPGGPSVRATWQGGRCLAAGAKKMQRRLGRVAGFGYRPPFEPWLGSTEAAQRRAHDGASGWCRGRPERRRRRAEAASKFGLLRNHGYATHSSKLTAQASSTDLQEHDGGGGSAWGGRTRPQQV